MSPLRVVAAVLLVLAVGASAAVANQPRWEDLSPQEREQAWRNFQEYQRLPEDRRRFLEQRYDRYQGLPPGERNRLKKNYDRYRGLDTPQRDQFHRQYREWKSRRKQGPVPGASRPPKPRNGHESPSHRGQGQRKQRSKR